MRKTWNKGLTKYTSASMMKTSRTMKSKKIDNFALWRKQMKAEGKMRVSYPALKKDGDLAELIGVILGDGHIRKFPRTEELSIFSHSEDTGFVARYSKLIERIFDKKPATTRHSGGNCTRIRIYQKHIQERLGIPYSPRGPLSIRVPKWIFQDKMYIVRYLRGLYEAEGCHCVHAPTGTYKLFFSNRNASMLKNVYRLVRKLGFHPHKSLYQVQVSRKEEVVRLIKLLEFRQY
jgi:DNA-binding transcriptional regulator WhiA